jgi:hypothetical protein
MFSRRIEWVNSSDASIAVLLTYNHLYSYLFTSYVFICNQLSCLYTNVGEALQDELTSVGVWIVVAGICLEACSLTFGFALGSIFAIGGIGSASIVLALRQSAENLLGGLLLRFQG